MTSKWPRHVYSRIIDTNDHVSMILLLDSLLTTPERGQALRIVEAATVCRIDIRDRPAYCCLIEGAVEARFVVICASIIMLACLICGAACRSRKSSAQNRNGLSRSSWDATPWPIPFYEVVNFFLVSLPNVITTENRIATTARMRPGNYSSLVAV